MVTTSVFGTSVSHSAGTIHVHRFDGSVIDLDTEHLGDETVLRGPTLVANESIRIVADGYTVPGFDITERFPDALTLIEPAIPWHGGHVPIDPTTDLVVRWIPVADTGDETVVLSMVRQFNVGDESVDVAVDCRAAPSAGTLIVPVRLITTLWNANSDPLPGSAWIAAERTTDVTPGPFRVHIRFSNQAGVGQLQRP